MRRHAGFIGLAICAAVLCGVTCAMAQGNQADQDQARYPDMSRLRQRAVPTSPQSAETKNLPASHASQEVTSALSDINEKLDAMTEELNEIKTEISELRDEINVVKIRVTR